MGFFLLRRDGDAVVLLSSTVFATRSEALADVSRTTSEDPVVAGEIFVADLDLAAPVLFVASEHSSATASSGDAGKAEQGAVPIEVEEPIAEAILADAGLTDSDNKVEDEPDPELPVEPDAPEVDEEPVVPEPEPVPDPAPLPELPSEPVVEEAPEPVVPEPEPLPEPPVEPASQPEPQSWPWDVPEVPDEPETADTSEPEAPDLPDEVNDVLEELDVLVPEVETATPEIAPAEQVVPDAPAPPVAPEHEDEPAEPSDAEGTSVTGESQPAEPPKAYEPGGSDITALTCDDCVYLNTCPKKEESDPSSCGSFQWRTV